MTTEDSFHQDLNKPDTVTADYGKAHSNAEIGSSPDTKSATVGEQYELMASDAMHGILECPVCFNLMHPPIHQCLNGHVLCSTCKAKVLNICPICRQRLGSIRCLSLEKVMETLGLPSRCSNFGCQDIIPIHSKLRHEQNCRFRPYKCPCNEAECFVTGDIQFLVTHLKDGHEVEVHDVCAFNHKYIKPNPEEGHDARWKLTVFNCFSHQFCLHFEAFHLGTAPVYMAFLRFMGNDDEAMKFSYSLEVGRFGRKLTWQGVPRSIRDSRKTVRGGLDGLVIPKNTALFFSDGDRQALKLTVAGRIWQEQ
ncbi:E3 ubiquitin-protein ligase SINAT2-like [Cornus florida]|uniref:E3 ubiquitin-protein ligase SINAT2-like n=1 Tax=Cornus florida TaxID=4283 RepID=UPI00289DC2CD|nr:E3 ubiquitin-protein ligase SINAT2-like [Cornus florida]